MCSPTTNSRHLCPAKKPTPTSRVLWVDDDRFMMRVFAHFLKSLGYSDYVLLTGESAGEDAVNLIRKEHFDVVITDRRMPNIDGFCVAEAVRDAASRFGRPPTSVLMVTGEDVFKELARGKDGTFSVPNWVQNSKRKWTYDVRVRARNLSVNLLQKPLTIGALKAALKLQPPCLENISFGHVETERVAIDKVCTFGKIVHADNENSPNDVDRKWRLTFWTWYDEPHRVASRLTSTRFMRCDDR